MRSSAFVWVEVITVAVVAALVGLETDGQQALPGSLETRHRPIELHHSLYHPFDQSTVYWKYGGSTVMTSKGVRLVPASQSRQGWLWNDYPLESRDWEIEVHYKVFSKPHFGGDGFAIWILEAENDPSYHFQPNWLNGDVFGLMNKFKGVGIIFDTYDNDGRRDNPTIFAVQKYSDGEFTYSHDNDFKNEMIRDPYQNFAYRCAADYRNTPNPFRVLIRFVNDVLHVYIDDRGDPKKKGEYNFCLAVQIQADAANKRVERHLAFTAMTGEVADAVEIREINTRYLDNKDRPIDDRVLKHSEQSARSRWTWLFWFVVTLAGAVLAVWTARDIVQLSQMIKAQTNPVYICADLNRLLLPHIYCHLGLVAYLFMTGTWVGVVLNLPLAGWRIFSIVKKSYLLDPAVLSGGGGYKGHARPKLSYSTRLYLILGSYVVSFIYYLTMLLR